ncbi:MAG: ThuA domain-containing protein [Actinomycetota bacterium]
MAVSGQLDVLVVTGGHPFEPEPFFAIFDELDTGDVSISWTAADAPAHGHDVVVFYDMPGLRFTGGAPPVELIEPSTQQRQLFADLGAAGTGLVFLHHAVASWPAWHGFAELVGARFHYQPAQLDGTDYPDSGYRFDVTHTVEVLDTEHPVCAGLSGTFDVTDELYCFPVLTDRVTPLMRTTFDTTDASQFYSADHAIRGRMNDNGGWTHPPGSDLVAWTRDVDRSRLVYLQFADGPATYADPSFRTALANAIIWTGNL